MFQVITILSRSSPPEMALAVGHMMNCPILCTVFSKEISKSGSLPLVDKWEKNLIPNHSAFAAIEEEIFLVGTCTHSALKKTSSCYLKKEFWTTARRFVEEIASAVLSTVVAGFKLGQGDNARGDDYSGCFLYGQLLHGLVECGCEKRSKVEACKGELQSFARERRKQEILSTKKRHHVGNILAYFSQQTGYQVAGVCSA